MITSPKTYITLFEQHVIMGKRRNRRDVGQEFDWFRPWAHTRRQANQPLENDNNFFALLFQLKFRIPKNVAGLLSPVFIDSLINIPYLLKVYDKDLWSFFTWSKVRYYKYSFNWFNRCKNSTCLTELGNCDTWPFLVVTHTIKKWCPSLSYPTKFTCCVL